MDKRMQKLDERDREIYRKWKAGTADKELAAEYGLSVAQIIHILAKEDFNLNKKT
jgi:Mor family transcriptional regulator